jgi:hypothetical protein
MVELECFGSEQVAFALLLGESVVQKCLQQRMRGGRLDPERSRRRPYPQPVACPGKKAQELKPPVK